MTKTKIFIIILTILTIFAMGCSKSELSVPENISIFGPMDGQYFINIKSPVNCTIDWKQSKFVDAEGTMFGVWPVCEQPVMVQRHTVSTSTVYANINYECVLVNSDEVEFGEPKDLESGTIGSMKIDKKIYPLSSKKIETLSYDNKISGWNIWDKYIETKLVLIYKLGEKPFNQITIDVPTKSPSSAIKPETTIAQPKVQPQNLSLPTDWFFAGSINSNSLNDIKIYVRFKQEGTNLSGTLYYKKYQVDMPITGTINNGDLTFYEIDTKGNQAGVFKGQLTHDSTDYNISGTWSKPNGDKQMPFLLIYGGSHPQDTLNDKYVMAAIKKMVGNEFERLSDKLSVSSSPKFDSDGNILLEGCSPHACMVSEAAVYLEKNGSISVAMLDDNKISYFTNNSNYKERMVAPLKKFAEGFPQARIIFNR